MTRSELITKLAAASDISTHKAEYVVIEIFDTMAETLTNGGGIEIRGFGSFSVREYQGRSGRNPKTGDEVEVSAKRRPFFKVGKALREKLADS